MITFANNNMETNIEKLEKIVKEEFSKFSLFDEKQPLNVYKNPEGQIWIDYQTAGPFGHHKSEGVSVTFVIAGDMGALNYFFVKEDQRNKGYGKELVEIAENIFKQAGCNYAEAKSEKEFAPFLKKFGYNEEEQGFYRKRW